MNWEEELGEYKFDDMMRSSDPLGQLENFIKETLAAQKQELKREIDEMDGAMHYLCTYDGEHPYAKEIEGFNTAKRRFLEKLDL